MYIEEEGRRRGWGFSVDPEVPELDLIVGRNKTIAVPSGLAPPGGREVVVLMGGCYLFSFSKARKLWSWWMLVESLGGETEKGEEMGRERDCETIYDNVCNIY